MTDQHHPLTDDICLAIDDNPSVAYSHFDWKKSMRTAADWQLEQVIEWMRDHNTGYIREDSMGIYFDDDKCIADLKKAMRPTTQEES